MKHKAKKYLVVTFSSPIGEKNVTTNLMKHKGKKYLVTFSSAIGEKNLITNLMKHKGKKYIVVTFSSPIGKKMVPQFAVKMLQQTL